MSGRRRRWAWRRSCRFSSTVRRRAWTWSCPAANDYLGHLLTDGDGFGELRLSSLAGEEGGFGLPEGFEPVAGDTLTLCDGRGNVDLQRRVRERLVFLP